MSTMQPTAPVLTSGRTVKICLGASVVVLIWSAIEVISLAFRHTNGAEVYGVGVAAVAVVAAAATVALLRSPNRRTLTTLTVLVIWAVIGLGGIAGVAAHVVGPVAGHGPIDLRPRPVLAPLIFTTFAFVGAAALLIGKRAKHREARHEKE